MLTEKQVEIASEAVAEIVKAGAAKYDPESLGKLAETTAHALVHGFNVINHPEQPTKLDLVVMLDNPAVKEKVGEIAIDQILPTCWAERFKKAMRSDDQPT